jgi:response regulator RpfG family c-di-GMP phosphodiesterase
MDRILVVDDDQLILQALGRILRTEGYDVVTHANPLEAAKEQKFAVVITDFMMPQMNGIELLGVLRETHPDAVRILLTAAADFKVATDAVNRGEIFRLLGKPWTLPDLLGCVQQAVGHYHLVQENARLMREVANKNSELVAMNRHLEQMVIERTNGLLDGLISALDYRDTETQWHSRRVALYSRRIAQACDIAGAALDVIEQGAMLHDIGKIGVRDSILLKPGPLTPEEWIEMKLHPELGYRILGRLPYFKEASNIVLQHQERYDGKGYPQGLMGEDIVIGARIFCVADTLDAITSDRPYRKGRALQVAKDEIRRCSGTQFDPKVVDAFQSVPDEDWLKIRQQVEGMEAEELRRFGPPAPRGPAAPAFAQAKQRPL